MKSVRRFYRVLRAARKKVITPSLMVDIANPGMWAGFPQGFPTNVHVAPLVRSVRFLSASAHCDTDISRANFKDLRPVQGHPRKLLVVVRYPISIGSGPRCLKTSSSTAFPHALACSPFRS